MPREAGGADAGRAGIARVYDSFLGGKDNFAPDRDVVRRCAEILPDSGTGARANRAFLRRAVTCMARAGIRQFLDIGAGLPEDETVHGVAREVDPAIRVAYVDNHPMVLSHARALLGRAEGTLAAEGDLRKPEEIFDDPLIREHLDLGRPVGVLLLGVVHHVRDEEDPSGIMARVRERMAPGSMLALSHFCNPGEERPEDAALAAECERVLSETLGTGRWRARGEILSYLGDFEVLEPGLVPLPEWRPDPDEVLVRGRGHHLFLGAVARKP
ncbi:SAM-dependent methyltransferase [Bailinhaonella thermotolerans]|uniref:SAM-dependent methyltransferase n=1 Tax=Bailinhaonella thermotolerans TaxID=1070861 RepID=A0A3A4ATA2_9ACTN|nr:SAM-dependent methyltransferase [Bailinhaonella thermotolerans]RJL30534.1 SAM-dependent methyltransferase [Bailinhaonella thermotolerans]